MKLSLIIGLLFVCLKSYSNSNDTNSNHKKVIIIGIDGVRSDMIQDTVAPNLYQFSQLKETYFNPKHKTEKKTWSGPNWSSICTGVHMKKHKVKGNTFIRTKFKKHPHFFSYINDLDTTNNLNLISIVHWRPINGQVGAEKYADLASKGKMSDKEVRDTALSIIANDAPISPDVLFLHFDDVDHAGHSHQFSLMDKHYRTAMKTTDEYVGSIIDAVSARKKTTKEDWLIIVISDHGGVKGSHGNGNKHPEVGNTILFLNHQSLDKTKINGSNMVDIVPTVLSFMGLYPEKIQSKFDGQPLEY